MKYFPWLLMVILLISCKEKQPDAIAVSNRELALAGIGNSVISRSFLDLQNSVNALNEFAISFQQDSVNTEKLLALRREWVSTIKVWKMSAIFSQGIPGTEIVSSDLYENTDAIALEAIISSDAPQFDQSYMQSLAEGSKGLAAIEYLIYGADKGKIEAVIAAFSIKGSRRGAFLRALCLDLKWRSDRLLHYWSIGGQGFLKQFTASNGPARSESIGVLTDAMIAAIARIKEKRLGAPLGVNQAQPNPELVESRYSGESLQLIRAEVQSVQQVFSGKRTLGVGSQALYWLLDESGARSGEVALSAALEARFADIFRKIDVIKIPLEQAVTLNREQLLELYSSIEKLQKMLENDVVTGLHFKS